MMPITDPTFNRRISLTPEELPIRHDIEIGKYAIFLCICYQKLALIQTQKSLTQMSDSENSDNDVDISRIQELVSHNTDLQKEVAHLRAQNERLKSRENFILRSVRYLFSGQQLYSKSNRAWDAWDKYLESPVTSKWPKEETRNLASALVARVMAFGILALFVAIAPIVLLLQQNRILDKQIERIDTQIAQFNSQLELTSEQTKVLHDQSGMFSQQTTSLEEQTRLFGKQNEFLEEQTRLFGNQNEFLEEQTRLFGKQNEFLEEQTDLYRNQDSLLTVQTTLFEKQNESIERQNKKFERQNNLQAFEQTTRFRELLLTPPRDTAGTRIINYYPSKNRHPIKWDAPNRALIAQISALAEQDSITVVDALYPLLRDDFVSVSSGALLALHPSVDTVWANSSNLQATYLRGAILRGANLGRANLQNAYLSYADLTAAILGAAILREAILIGANLQNADLRGADFKEAHLGGADLRGANLRGANLIGADLSGANLIGADLSGADLSGAFYSSTTKFPDSLNLEDHSMIQFDLY